MKWNKEAVQDLKDYERLEQFIDGYPEQMAALEDDMTAVRGAATDKTPVQGGGSRMEDALINNIAKRERLTLNYAAAEKRYRLIKNALEKLDDRDRLLLDRFFIHRHGNHVDRLCEELHLEQAQVYRLKDQALYKFTLMMYGITEY